MCQKTQALDNQGLANEPGGDRTHDPQIKSLLLYQLSYRPDGGKPLPIQHDL
jgi:hypothetical protein